MAKSKVHQRDVQATTAEWRRLGEDDPLFAVAAHEDKRGSWGEDEFYALGKSDWFDFEQQWRQYKPDLGGAVVELGSGAGRITRALASSFDTVHGLDVSQHMLDRAKVAAPSAEFHVVEGTSIPLGAGTVDAVFTCHVLQHLEHIGVVTDYLTDARRVLRPGGSIMAHLLVAAAPSRLPRRIWSEVKLRTVRARQANRGAYSRVRLYRPDEVREAMEAAGFVDIQLREFRVRSNGVVHAFWFGRAAT